MTKVKTLFVLCFLLGGVFVTLNALSGKNAAQGLQSAPRLAAENNEADKAAASPDKIAAQLAGLSSTPRAATPAAALVNGVAITAADLNEELDNLLVSSTTHAKIDPNKKDEFRRIALDELIVRELAYQKAKAMRLKADKKEFAAALKKIKDRYKTEKTFRQALKIEEMTEQEFEQRIEKDLLLRKINQTEIEDKSQVSDDEAKRYYEEFKSKFVLPESIHLKNIVVKAEPGKEDEAKKRIDEVHEKLKAGADFYEMAYKFSEDDYRVLGGDYGSVHRGQIVAELEAAAFEAKLNVLTGPFKTGYGWHIIRVESKQTERQLKFEEVKERIKDSLHQKRRNERRQEFIKGLKAAAQIEYVSK